MCYENRPPSHSVPARKLAYLWEVFTGQTLVSGDVGDWARADFFRRNLGAY